MENSSLDPLNKLMIAGEFQQSLAFIERMDDDLKGRLEIRYAKAICDFQLGDLSSSYTSFLALREDLAYSSEFLSNFGLLLLEMNKADEAEIQLKIALELDPSNLESRINLAVALERTQRYSEARSVYEELLSSGHDTARILFNLSNVLNEMGETASSIKCLKRCLDKSPHDVRALNNLGELTRLAGEDDAAEGYLTRCLELDANHPTALNNLGLIHLKRGEISSAKKLFQHAIEVRKDYIDAYSNLSITLDLQGDSEDAVNVLTTGLKIDKSHLPSLVQLANIYIKRGMLLEAYPLYMSAVALEKHQNTDAYELGLFCHIKLGKNPKYWPHYQEPKVRQIPFLGLALEDSPKLHQASARQYWKRKNRGNQHIQRSHRHKKNGRIRIGYFSSDFHGHATSHLIANLFELHDYERFDIFIYSYGKPSDHPLIERIKKHVTKFHNCFAQPDYDIAELASQDRLDIAIDLKGYTENERTDLFALSLAPLQISYLGYPGTLGSKCFDYIVADHYTIPIDAEPYYDEKIIRMPFCYQVNDSKRYLPRGNERTIHDATLENYFVFACFNNIYKISEEIFSSWMYILDRASNAVLLLIEDNVSVQKNLTERAERYGLGRDRLYFLPRVAVEAHLQRHSLVDLFLDTFPYNAHTTASDAIWCAKPILTISGRSFASRVAGSLLSTMGLDEFICSDVEEYKSKALYYFENQEKLYQAEALLNNRRATSPLFDCARFARHFEAALAYIYGESIKGSSPQHVDVSKLICASTSESYRVPVCNKAYALDSNNHKESPSVKRSVEAKNSMNLLYLLGMTEKLCIVDVGASTINECPRYDELVLSGYAHLHAVEGDLRQHENIAQKYCDAATLHPHFLADGREAKLYITSEESGMTSLYEPDLDALGFFNGFLSFGRVSRVESISTVTLDSLKIGRPIDFIKLDVQGSELCVLKHGLEALESVFAVQLEVSFVPLYKQQPTFGEVDLWMRSQGFIPHSFVELKRWSISPLIKNNDFRQPFNQLLEADIIYIRDPMNRSVTKDSLVRAILISSYILKSPDLAFHLLERLTSIYPEFALHREGVLAELRLVCQ